MYFKLGPVLVDDPRTGLLSTETILNAYVTHITGEVPSGANSFSILERDVKVLSGDQVVLSTFFVSENLCFSFFTRCKNGETRLFIH